MRPYRVVLGWLIFVGVAVVAVAAIYLFLPQGICGSVLSPERAPYISPYAPTTAELRDSCAGALQEISNTVIVTAAIGLLTGVAATVALIISRRAQRSMPPA